MSSASDQAIASTCKLSASSSLTDASDQQVAPVYFMKQLAAHGHQFSSLVDTNQKSVSFPQGMESSKHSLLVGRNSDSFLY